MRQTIVSVCVALSGLMGMSSCDLYVSDNGALDGFWQMERVDTLATGGGADVTAQRIFWSVQCDMLQVSDLTYQRDACVLRFEHKGTSLRLYDPYRVDHAGSDVALVDASELAPFGIESIDQKFVIDRLDASAMQLTGSNLQLRFRKY